MIRVAMTFSLKRLEKVEFERIKALSPEALGPVEPPIPEPIPVAENVTFHPSFGYEDFIEGLRPVSTDEGILNYRVEEGLFKLFSRRALNALLSRAGIKKEWVESGNLPRLDNSEKKALKELAHEVPFYLIIDEINRGDIARIFGELITLLEADKRLCEENEIIMPLPYSKLQFGVPPNLFIIGTMNTADKSIALVDIALRRRFGFVELMPDYHVLNHLFSKMDPAVKEIADLSALLLQALNQKILETYDRDHQIGHSYVIRLKDAGTEEEAIETLHFIWYNDIIPLLQEYYYDSPRKLLDVLGKRFVTLSPNERSFSLNDMLSGDEFIYAVKELANGKVESEIPAVSE